jgi:DNA-binding transcriptional LysR family regulator
MLMAINLRQIEAFRAVMITGSATEAAKMLFISQPAVSRLISDLEYRCHLTLFIRKPNRLEATPEAQAFYREVDRAFIGLEEISRSAAAIANKEQGSLRIVAMPVCVDSFLPALIAQFREAYPNVSIELESSPRIQALDMVRSQRLELGVVSLTGNEDVGLSVQTLCYQEAVCILPLGHALAKKDEIEAKDLVDEPFISLSQGSPFRARFNEIFQREGVQPNLAIETRYQRTVYELVKQGAGVSIVDSLIISDNDANVVVKPFVPKLSWQYAIVQPHASVSSLIAQAFSDLLIAHFKQSS